MGSASLLAGRVHARPGDSDAEPRCDLDEHDEAPSWPDGLIDAEKVDLIQAEIEAAKVFDVEELEDDASA